MISASQSSSPMVSAVSCKHRHAGLQLPGAASRAPMASATRPAGRRWWSALPHSELGPPPRPHGNPLASPKHPLPPGGAGCLRGSQGAELWGSGRGSQRKAAAPPPRSTGSPGASAHHRLPSTRNRRAVDGGTRGERRGPRHPSAGVRPARAARVAPAHPSPPACPPEPRSSRAPPPPPPPPPPKRPHVPTPRSRQVRVAERQARGCAPPANQRQERARAPPRPRPRALRRPLGLRSWQAAASSPSSGLPPSVPPAGRPPSSAGTAAARPGQRTEQSPCRRPAARQLAPRVVSAGSASHPDRSALGWVAARLPTRVPGGRLSGGGVRGFAEEPACDPKEEEVARGPVTPLTPGAHKSHWSGQGSAGGLQAPPSPVPRGMARPSDRGLCFPRVHVLAPTQPSALSAGRWRPAWWARSGPRLSLCLHPGFLQEPSSHVQQETCEMAVKAQVSARRSRPLPALPRPVRMMIDHVGGRGGGGGRPQIQCVLTARLPSGSGQLTSDSLVLEVPLSP